MKKILFIASICFFYITSYSQRATYWYFGRNAGIKFTPTGPIAVNDGKTLNLEGCASISDEFGNLLFYTDGVTVWNRKHQVMANGSGLMGGNSSCQSSIVIPHPGNDSLYYIFTAPQDENRNVNDNYTFNIINVKRLGGDGEVVSKNNIFEKKATERITAVTHANGIDFWIITSETNTNNYRAYLVTKNGFDPSAPVLSSLGRISPGNQTRGMLKASPDGKYVIQSSWLAFPVLRPQLMQFNNATGILTNPIILNYPNAYGISFSPNSTKVYFSLTTNSNVDSSIVQFDLSVGYDSAAINNTKYGYRVNRPSALLTLGDMSLGPDGIIYTPRTGSRVMTGIKFPDSAKNKAMIVDTALFLASNAITQLGLPNFYNNIALPPSSRILFEQLNCLTYRFSFQVNYTDPSTFKWDLGDGTISNDSFPIYTFKRTQDSFIVKFNFKSTDGKIDIIEQVLIKLPPKPIADFSFTTNQCLSDTVRFKSTASNFTQGVKYLWQMGNGDTDSVANPQKKYLDTGNYRVQLYLQDSLKCISDTIIKMVAITKKIMPGIKVHPLYCSRTAFVSIDSSIGINTTINNWKINMGDGNMFNSSVPNITHTYTKEGVYTIKLFVSSAECSSDTFSRNIEVYARPLTGFILPENCVNDLSNFTDTSKISANNINYWHWRFGNDLANALNPDTSILQNPSHKYSRADFYDVTLITRSNQFCYDTLVQKFTVNGAVPTAKLILPQLEWCTGDSIKLINTSLVDFGGLSSLQIKWDSTNTFVDDSPFPNKSYAFKYNEFGQPDTKTQKIQYRIQSGINCTDVLDTVITLKAQPRVVFDTIKPACNNSLPFVLNQARDTSGSNGNGGYSGRGVFFSNTSYQFDPRRPSANTVSAITFRFTSTGGCFDEKKRSIAILPFPVANAGTDKRVLEGDSVLMNATAFGNNLSYNWLPPLLLSNNTLLNPYAYIKDDITYQLRVTNDVGCFDTNSVFIKALKPVLPPNAFSPNGDGIHDRWEIPELFYYSGCIVEVFNRYGQPVYRSVNYTSGWDGTSFGKPLPVGTYYYVIQPGSGRKRIAGWVAILR